MHHLHRARRVPVLSGHGAERSGATPAARPPARNHRYREGRGSLNRATACLLRAVGADGIELRALAHAAGSLWAVAEDEGHGGLLVEVPGLEADWILGSRFDRPPHGQKPAAAAELGGRLITFGSTYGKASALEQGAAVSRFAQVARSDRNLPGLGSGSPEGGARGRWRLADRRP